MGCIMYDYVKVSVINNELHNKISHPIDNGHPINNGRIAVQWLILIPRIT